MSVGQLYTIAGEWSSGYGDIALNDVIWAGSIDPSFKITGIINNDPDYILTAQMLTDGTLPVTDDFMVIDPIDKGGSKNIQLSLTADVIFAGEAGAVFTGGISNVRLIPFTYAKDTTYEVELGNGYMRFFKDNVVLKDSYGNEVWLASPYLGEEIYDVQYAQVANTMWLVHPLYQRRKLVRTSETEFTLTAIENVNGPFLTRNDIIDPTVTDVSTMKSSVVNVGETGTLTFDGDDDFFETGHIGAIFKLIHPNPDTKVDRSGGGYSASLYVKGTFTFRTSSTRNDGKSWSGTVVLQRSENGVDWDDFRTYVGNADRNIINSFVENKSNIQYRIYAKAGMTSDFRGYITLDNAYIEGIVRINSLDGGSPTTIANVTVVARLASNANNVATTRWAEGAWSGVRGYPSSVAFFEERCIYGSMCELPEQITGPGGGGVE